MEQPTQKIIILGKNFNVPNTRIVPVPVLCNYHPIHLYHTILSDREEQQPTGRKTIITERNRNTFTATTRQDRRKISQSTREVNTERPITHEAFEIQLQQIFRTEKIEQSTYTN